MLTLVPASFGCATAQPVDYRAATLVRYHADPSVPPPYHSEWLLTVTPDHGATYRVWMGYPGTPGVLPSENRFVVPAARYDALIAALTRAGISQRATRPGEPDPPGSPTDIIEVTEGVRALKIQAARAGDAAGGVGPVFQAFDACRPPG